jgi:hypothetical protein
MRTLLIDFYHILVIVMMASSILLCTLAASGMFDIWGNRYKRRGNTRFNRNNELS